MKYFFLLSGLLIPCFSMAEARKFSTAVCLGPYVYVQLSNPSSVTQTVTIKVIANANSAPLYILAGQWGHGSATCSTANLCTNSTSYRTIPPGGTLAMGVAGSSLGANSDPKSGIYATVEVLESEGYLMGDIRCQNGGFGVDMVQSINGGRPF